MGPKIPQTVRSVVLAFSTERFSYNEIVKRLKGQGIVISKTAVHNIVKNIGKRNQARSEGHPSPKKKQPSKVVTPAIRRKIDLLTSRENPPSQREISKITKVSKSTVNRIIKNLDKVLRRKSRVHKLLPRHLKNRKTNCRKLYERVLAGQRSEFVVSLDEAMFGLHNCHGKRKICYVQKGQTIPRNWFVDKDNFLETFMVVGAISGRGPLPLIRVPKKVKVNSQFYIDKVLKPLLETHLPSLYPNDLSSVTVHHDAAPSHTAKKTQAYARDLEHRLGIKILKNSEIPVKSPDVSPMDFFGFGYLKKNLP